MKKNKLELYVWTGFQPDWTDGLAFAIASSEAEAKQLVCERYGWGTPSVWGDLTIHPLNKKTAECVSGGS